MKNHTLDTRIDMIRSQYDLLCEAFELSHHAPTKEKQHDTEMWICEECKGYMLPHVEKLINGKLLDENRSVKVYELWEKVMALTARRSFHHFLLYIEKDREPEGKTYHLRQNVLKPLVDYLEKMTFSERFLKLEASYPPGYGKSLIMWLYAIWVFGVNQNHSFIKMSYSENLLDQFSGSMQEYMQSKEYTDIFVQYQKYNGDIFSKTKLSDWKIKDTPTTPMSHISRTRDGQVTGTRANFMIIYDDMTKGYEEAFKENVHEEYWGKYVTEWTNRKSKTNVKEAFIGTMWNPNDILGRIQRMMMMFGDEIKSIEKFGVEHIVEIYKEGVLHGVIIRVPQLDENEQSTCEYARTTEEAHLLRQSMSEFEWQCVYQQQPIPPEGRPFDYEQLRTYESFDGTNALFADGTKVKLSDCSTMVIDPTRKGVDYVACPIFKTEAESDYSHYLIDTIFRGKSMDEVYDAIVDKVFIHNVNLIVLENNVDASLKYVLDQAIKERGRSLNKDLVVEIREKHNTENKGKRIRDNAFAIVEKLVFPKRGLYPPNSDFGKFMQNTNHYSLELPNKHDDAPDSLAMYVKEVIKKTKTENKAVAISAKKFWGY